MRETHFKKFQMFFTDISFRNIKKVSIVKVTLEVRLMTQATRLRLEESRVE